MLDDHLITHGELDGFHPGDSLAGELQALLLHQRSAWDLARMGYEARAKAETRPVTVDDVGMVLQHNPGRIKSTTARVDRRSTAQRPCFLCADNLPEEQKGILFGNDYLILVNPYPIFPEHFTVPRTFHVPQRIQTEIEVLLDLARDAAPGFLALYNGPACGASAPDHLHFQLGTRGYLPLEREYAGIRERWGRLLAGSTSLQCYSIDHYLPPFLALESVSRSMLVDAFRLIYGELLRNGPTGEEPMMNLLSWYDEEGWRLIVFLRAKHRPARFSARGEKRMLISPGAIDLGGVMVVPVEKDYRRMKPLDVQEIIEEVVLPQAAYREVTARIADIPGLR